MIRYTLNTNPTAPIFVGNKFAGLVFYAMHHMGGNNTDNNHQFMAAISLQRDVEDSDLFCMSLRASRANMAILARNKARMWTTSGNVLRMLRNALRS